MTAAADTAIAAAAAAAAAPRSAACARKSQRGEGPKSNQDTDRCAAAALAPFATAAFSAVAVDCATGVKETSTICARFLGHWSRSFDWRP